MRIITGRASVCTDADAIREIKEFITADPLSNVIVLVPPQATYLTEKYILDELGVPGIMGLSVMSPDKLTQKINDTVYGRAVPVMDSAGKCMLLDLLLFKYSDRLPQLGGCGDRAAMAGDLAALISELKIMDITPDMLRGFEASDAEFSKKLNEIAFLAEKFDERTKVSGITPQDRTNIAATHVGEADIVRSSHVYVMGFDMFSEQMLRYLCEIDRTAKSLTVIMPDTDIGSGDEDVFSLPRSYIKRLASMPGAKVLPAGKKRLLNSDIAHIEKYIYSYPFSKKEPCGGVGIVRCDTKEQEISACCEIIARLMKKGLRPADIAVVAADMQPYYGYIRKHFSSAHIPYFFDEKRALTENPLSDFILSGLKLCCGRLDKARLISHIKCGLLGTEGERGIIASLLREHIGNPYRVTKPFPDDAAEKARQACVVPVLSFIKKIRAEKSVCGITEVLEKYLASCGVQEWTEDIIKECREAGHADAAEYYAQVAEKTKDILAQLRILGNEAADAFLVHDMIKSAMTEHSVSIIPIAADVVFFGNAVMARLPKVKTLILIGVNDGVLPDYKDKPGILTFRQKDSLLTGLTGQHSSSNIFKQRLAVYKLLSSPEEKLILCYHSSGGEGEAQPSSIVTKITEMFSLKHIPASEIIGKTLLSNALSLAKEDIRRHFSGEKAKHGELLSLLMSGGKAAADVARYISLGRPSDRMKLPRNIAGKLYSLRGSVSRYQKYYSCPYSFFMLYGIRPYIDNVPEILHRDEGTYIHALLDAFMRSVKKDNARLADMSPADIKKRLKYVSAEVRTDTDKFSSDAENTLRLDALDAETELLLASVCREKACSESSVEETEYRFSLDIGDTNVTGAIDRLDTGMVDENKYFSIVDYKTGKTAFSETDFYKGLSLQLTLYLLAAKAAYPEYEPAGAGFVNIHQPFYESIDKAGTDMAKEYAARGVHVDDARVLEKMYGMEDSAMVGVDVSVNKDGRISKRSAKSLYSNDEISKMMRYTGHMIAKAAEEIRNGNIEASPAADSAGNIPCDVCDFKTVCGAKLCDAMEPEKLSRKDVFEKISEALGK